MGRPLLTPGPTTTGRWPLTRSATWVQVDVSAGTTLAMTASSMQDSSRPLRASWVNSI